MSLSRRGFFGGVLATLAAPAIIRTPGLLMPVKPVLIRRTPEADYIEATMNAGLIPEPNIYFLERMVRIADTPVPKMLINAIIYPASDFSDQALIHFPAPSHNQIQTMRGCSINTAPDGPGMLCGFLMRPVSDDWDKRECYVSVFDGALFDGLDPV